MKKWIIAAILLVVILVIPIPTGVAEDGSSRSYTALTYKIVDWSHTYAGGVYDETKVYPFPMNFRSLDELLILEEPNFIKSVPTEPATEPPTESITEQIPFSAQYVRTDGYHDGRQYPVVTRIRSQDALDDYYWLNKSEYFLERRENPASDYTIGFLDACDRYSDAWFEENELFLILLEEGSGSIRHEVTDVQAGQEALQVHIDSIIPEIGTCDMAQWHIFVEVPKTDSASVVEIYWNGKLQYAQRPREILLDNSARQAVLYSMGESYPIADGYIDQLTQLLQSLSYSPYRVCKCLPQYKIEIEDVSYGIHLTEGYARCDAGQAALSREQIDLLTEMLDRTIQDQLEEFSYAKHLLYYQDDPGVVTSDFVNAESCSILNAHQAIERAKKECTVAYDSVAVSYDRETQIYMVCFYRENYLGGNQNVYLNSDGITQMILYGE